MRWDRAIISDPEDYTNKSATDILKDLYSN